MRKIMQIQAVAAKGFFGDDPNYVLALCDDGTLWIKSLWDDDTAKNIQWNRIDDIPQEAK